MKLPVKRLHPDAQLPTRGTPESAGLDLYASNSATIPPDAAGEIERLTEALAASRAENARLRQLRAEAGKPEPQSQLARRCRELSAMALDHIKEQADLNSAITERDAEIERLREAVTRLLACPAIADEDFSDPEWGCAETREAEAFARAALAGEEGK